MSTDLTHSFQSVKEHKLRKIISKTYFNFLQVMLSPSYDMGPHSRGLDMIEIMVPMNQKKDANTETSKSV